MYVAITRARQRLYLSHSQTRMLHGQTRYNVKSRFFEELPEGALKWLTPKNQRLRRSTLSATAAGYATRAGRALRADLARMPRRSRARPCRCRRPPPAHGLRSGMQVFHNKFGEGTVLALEGGGDDARAQINFPRHGVKWLALSVAKLTVV